MGKVVKPDGSTMLQNSVCSKMMSSMPQVNTGVTLVVSHSENILEHLIPRKTSSSEKEPALESRCR